MIFNDSLEFEFNLVDRNIPWAYDGCVLEVNFQVLDEMVLSESISIQ